MTHHGVDDSVRQVMRLAEERDVLRLKLIFAWFAVFLLCCAVFGLVVRVRSCVCFSPSSTGAPATSDAPIFQGGAK
jgi:hypothetical protein